MQSLFRDGKVTVQFVIALMQLTTKENGSSVYCGHILKWILSLCHTINKIDTFCEKQDNCIIWSHA